MKKLALDAIRLDGETQARVSLNQDVVTEYAAHMQEGDTFPSIVVFHDGSDYWLADGFHRYMAHKQNKATEIECDVRTGTLEEARLYAYGANGRRGLSLSREDKRKIVLSMLKHPEWKKWANTEIAKHVGCSSMTVGRIKSGLVYDAEKEQPKKVVRNGKVQEVKTQNLGKQKKVVEIVEAEQESDTLAELTDTINELHTENQKLKDAIAIGQWDASEIEKLDIQETVEELREKARVLEIDNAALRDSRDMFQARNAELMQTVKNLQTKLRKIEAAA